MVVLYILVVGLFELFLVKYIIKLVCIVIFFFVFFLCVFFFVGVVENVFVKWEILVIVIMCGVVFNVFYVLI